jgi:CheY-like chemotaxis protein
MGLGLSVCHSIISRHNGRITAESRKGSGATVEFFLPASDEKPAERRPPNILIMDDELVVLDMAAGILAEAGMKVASARTGEEAVKLYGEAKANGAPFDAVILDLTIPGAMGGLATLRKLMSIEPGVKAIVSSGYLNDVVLTNYREHGFMAAVPKPYKPEDLLRTVTHVTGRGSVYH